eukprot:CAMPEP_0113510786 /NCGR_PEP_ID=MMETSP0014_2-20120614/38333_1 /TAXON_ID=2857 /ORGANISM="Nitzschia sp." /LENGTH=761 /DNA_ID=CAMNT_0000406783 /DNA_START=92 /DNA_END=2377 /DNA_ORIENTATION=+ /assembly_acc=CAM_ASM_000159
MPSVRPVPPVARREEDAVVYAGVAPPGWDSEIPRQANDSTEPMMDPPVAVPNVYGWLRDDTRKSQEILDHLEAENAYTKQVTKHLDGLQQELYDEFLQSIQETDYTVPLPRGDYWYYTRTIKGSSYRQYCRAPKPSGVGIAYNTNVEWDGTPESTILDGEQVYLDVNKLAVDKKYCSVTSVKPSPSHKFIVYSVDFSGDEKYELHVLNLETMEDTTILKKDSKEPLEISGNALWGSDDDTLFYMTQDSAQRPDKLYVRYNWQDEEASKEYLLMDEPDDLYWCGCYKSLDGKFIFFEAASKETSEISFLSTDSGEAPVMQPVAARRNKVLYEVEHRDGQWWVWTNVDGSPNMKLMTSPAVANSDDQWTLVADADGKPVFDGSSGDRSLSSVTVFKDHVVIEGREGGIPRVWIYQPSNKSVHRLSFDEPAHDVVLSAHYEFEASSIIVGYDSLVTPPSTIEISLNEPDQGRNVLKSKTVPGYQKDIYGCDRLEVLSRDGKTKIPISVVYQKDVYEKVKNGEQVPVHLYGYGSYGSCCEADFSSTRLPLLKRGMIYVIAHIRGGGEMGREWYEEPNGAKYLCKKNTFNDFVDVARYLIYEKWTTSDLLSCEGRSAGGMLVGSCINQAPELFRVAIMGVPFVDVVSTMIDASIPLTSGEWVEWGNPNEIKYHQYMMEYSPMDTVKSGVQYPSVWATGGLFDPRVAYWEPAKFVATLRHANPDATRPVCMKMDVSAGHFSASDRYKYYRELAYDYSFLLDQLGLVK